MLVKLAGLISMAAGSVGGATFSRNRSGAYVRNRTKPVDPSTTRQNDQRTRMSSSVIQWSALTEAQRQAFNAKALVTDFTNRLGESIHPSGMNLFIRAANLLQQAGLSAITIPPVRPVLDDGNAFTSYTAVTGLEMNATTANWPANAVLLVNFAIDLTNSTNYYKGPYPSATSLVLLDFTADVAEVVADADLQADSVQAVSWRLVGEDGAASAIRRYRTIKPPA